MRARGLALVGDRAACCDALHTAQRILGGVADEEPAQWIAVFDAASLGGEAALCFLELVDLAEAERHARDVIRQRSGDRIRSRTFAQLTLAKVLVHAGRLDEAVAVGHQACSMTASLTSIRVLHQLRALGGMLSLAPKAHGITAFLATVAGLSATADQAPNATSQWPV
jgi:fatty acid-binding protein DegV